MIRRKNRTNKKANSKMKNRRKINSQSQMINRLKRKNKLKIKRLVRKALKKKKKKTKVKISNLRKPQRLSLVQSIPDVQTCLSTWKIMVRKDALCPTAMILVMDTVSHALTVTTHTEGISNLVKSSSREMVAVCAPLTAPTVWS